MRAAYCVLRRRDASRRMTSIIVPYACRPHSLEDGVTGTGFPLVTAEALLHFRALDHDYELVRGRLVVMPFSSGRRGVVAANLVYRVGDFVEREELGIVTGKAGFWIRSDPDTVRAPDLAFVDRSRVSLIPRVGYARLTPDLAAEILEHDDRPANVLRRIGDWLDTGARLVWVIDPERFEARVYRADGSLSLVHRDGALDGEDVLPGLTCPLWEIVE